MQPQPDNDIADGASTEEFTTVYAPGEPEGQAERIAEENRAKASSYPIMGEIYQWFDEAVANCPDITNVIVDSQEIEGVVYNRQVSIEGQVLAFQLLKKLLMEKRDEFKEYKFEE